MYKEGDEDEGLKYLQRGFRVKLELKDEIKESLNKIFAKTGKFCCFTAPYEADQQMAYMYYSGKIDLAVASNYS